MQDKNNDAKQIHYLLYALPKDLANIYEVFIVLPQDSQEKKKSVLIDVLQNKYEKIQMHFIHNKQITMENEFDLQVEILKVREY